MSYVRGVGTAPHKARYSHSSELTSSFTLQAYFRFFTTLQIWFAFPCCHHPAYFALYLSLLEQPLLSELLWSGTLITDQSCFTAAVALTKAREVSQNIRQNGCQKHPCYSITGIFTAHGFIKDASTVSGTRGRQQCDKTQPCPTGCSVCPCFPLVAAVSDCVSGLTGFKTSALW